MRQRHWKNYGQGGEVSFVTTTCLDKAMCFVRPKIKSAVALSIAQDCLRYDANLYAFVVMSSHIHLLIQPDDQMSVPNLIQRIKRNSSSRLSPLLNAQELALVTHQTELNKRQLWQRSFHSIPLDKQNFIDQKALYIEENPVRAGLVKDASEYLWCSSFSRLNGARTQTGAICLDEMAALYKTEDF